MRVEHGFNPYIDRYAFDFKQCTYALGWAQVDTYQDASYFGIWTSPRERAIVTYAEGDVTTVSCDSDSEYQAELLRTLLHYTDGTDRWPHAKIDPGIGSNRWYNMERAAELGLAAYLH